MDRQNFISIEYQESNNELEMEMHLHNLYEIIYVIEGRAQFDINNKIYDLYKGTLIFINNLENHKFKVLSSPYKRYFILINPAWFQSVINDPVMLSIFKNRPEHFHHAIYLNEKIINTITAQFEKILDESKSRKDYWELAIKSYLQELFITLYRNHQSAFPLTSHTRQMEVIFQVQKHIEEKCTEEISLDYVSRLFYMDKFYLSRLFKQITGFSFKEYVILQRISRAKEKLFYTNDSVIKVAADSGFNNINHFIRIFKKYTGTTPMKYRLAARNNRNNG